MRADKYPIIPKITRGFFTLESGFVGKSPNKAPIVVGRNHNRMALTWWNEKQKSWNNHVWESDNFGSIDPFPKGSPDERESYKWSMSLRQGLAADENQTFCIYQGKRGLKIKHFIWKQADSELIITNPEEKGIPSLGRKYLGGLIIKSWISSVTNQLLVLCQTFPSNPDGEAQLTLLRYNLPDQVTADSLVDSNSWIAQDLGPGGYDFDAWFTDPLIHVVHKSLPYQLYLEENRIEEGLNDFTLDDIPPDQYIALEFLVYDVHLQDVTQQETIGPGSHPCIQSVTPVRVTADLPAEGSFSIERKLVDDPPENYIGPTLTGMQYIQDSFDSKIKSMQKIVFEFDKPAGIWRQGTINYFNPNQIPRLTYPRFLEQVLVNQDQIFWGFMETARPFYLFDSNPGGDIDRPFIGIQHDPDQGLLKAESFRIVPDGDTLDISGPHRALVLDINHEHIGDPDTLTPSAINENFHFLPRVKQNDILLHKDGLFTQVLPRFHRDSTIGTHLMIDHHSWPRPLFAYLDDGDAGLRVIYDDQLEFPTLSAWNPGEDFPLSAVQGPGCEGDTWIETHIPSAGWLQYDLPGYQADSDDLPLVSLPHGLQVRLTDGTQWYQSNTLEAEIPWLDVLPEDSHDDITDTWEPIWTNLWEIMRGINQDPDPNDEDAEASGQPFRVWNSTLTLDTCELHFKYSAGQPGSIEIDLNQYHDHLNQINSAGLNQRQGQINLRMPIRFFSDHIRTGFDNIFRIYEIDASFHYGRAFTPAVLRRDARQLELLFEEELDPPQETIPAKSDSALAAKPIGDTFLEEDKIDIKCDWTILGGITAVLLMIFGNSIIGLLLAFGLTGIEGDFSFLLEGLIAAVMAIGTGIGVAPGLIAAAILVAEIVALLVGVPRLIASEVRKNIRSAMDPEEEDQVSIKRSLEEQQILTYAGEGLAEALARSTIKQAVREGKLSEDQGLIEKVGYTRYRKQFWQMIYVRDNICRVLIRPAKD